METHLYKLNMDRHYDKNKSAIKYKILKRSRNKNNKKEN